MVNFFFKLFLLFLFFFNGSLMAQDAMQIWNMARKSAKSDLWKETADLIRPHIFPAPVDSLSPSLIQLYAISCFKLGDYPSAIVSSERVLETYPTWRGVQEAKYLLGEIALKQFKINQALYYWKELGIQFETRLIQSYSISYKHLSGDSILKAISNPLISNSFLLKILESEQKEISATIKKEPLKVGVLLSFEIPKNKIPLKESASLDFYRGFLLASEVLTALDSAVQVFAFDYNNSSKLFQEIVKSNSFSGLDVLIGPVRFSFLPGLEDWANDNNTLIINPLSNQALVQPSRNIFSQEPSFTTISRNAFEFVSKTSTGLKVGIIFGPEKNDSIQAEAYRILMRKMGKEVALWKKVGKNSAANLAKFLFEAGLDSTSHLFVANSEPLVRVQLPGAYSWTKAKYPVVVCGKWMESSSADYDEYSRLPFYFINPDFPNHEHIQWLNWENSFVSKWGSPPNWLAWKGFDLAYSFSKLWYSKSAFDFSNIRKSGALRSELFREYRFSRLETDNQFVPIFRFENGDIVKVWPE